VFIEMLNKIWRIFQFLPSITDVSIELADHVVGSGRPRIAQMNIERACAWKFRREPGSDIAHCRQHLVPRPALFGRMHSEIDPRREQCARQMPIDDRQAVVRAEDTVKKDPLVPQSGDVGVTAAAISSME
jgi:hypothetical protein